MRKCSRLCFLTFSLLSVFGQGSWVSLAPMPTPRQAFGIAQTPDGRIFTIGGDTFSIGTYMPVGKVEVYDPQSNSWTTAAPMPTPRYSLTAAYSNGLIYAFGGYSPFAPRNTVEAYDPSTNTWSARASMPTARHNLRAVTAADGKIYVIGGDTSGGGQNVATVEVYDPVANTWTTGVSMPFTKSGHGVALGNNGRIYAIGGGQSGQLVGSVFEYEVGSAAWSIKSPMSLARSNLTVATTSDGRIVAIGGESYGVVSDFVEVYSINGDSWQTGVPMPTARAGLSAIGGTDGRIYAIGGWVPVPGGLIPLGANEAYTPESVATYQICPLFDTTKAVRSGATIPIKLQLCGENGANLSSSEITVHATGLMQESTNATAEIQDAGNANPDSDFRYDASLGGSGGYIFNLKTTGFSSGTYRLSFTASTGAATYSITFQVR